MLTPRETFTSSYIQLELSKTRRNRTATRNMVEAVIQTEMVVNIAVKLFIILS
jgi:hypothetical protein